MRRRKLVNVISLPVLLTKPIIPPPVVRTFLTNSDCCLLRLAFLSSSWIFSSSCQIGIQMQIQIQQQMRYETSLLLSVAFHVASSLSLVSKNTNTNTNTKANTTKKIPAAFPVVSSLSPVSTISSQESTFPLLYLASEIK